MKTKKIGILGAGWLGKAFGQHLQEKGVEVLLSTASTDRLENLKAAGLSAVQVSISPEKVIGAIDQLLDVDTLMINIPPYRKDLTVEQFAALRPLIQASRVKQVLFISSTSVYEAHNTWVEETSSRKISHPLYKSEAAWQAFEVVQTTIVRLAGLVGAERHPGRFFKKTGHIKSAQAPINLIHRADCLQILTAILEQDVWGEVFNACSDTHPTKGDFYPVAARSLGLLPPTLGTEEIAYKLVDNQKMKAKLGVDLKHPDLRNLLEAGAWY